MKKLTTIAALLKLVRQKPKLAACAMAALLFLSALHAPASAQGTANTYGGLTVVNGGTIGLVPGQRVSITVPNFYFAADGSVRFVKHTIRVTENQSGLVYSGESGGLNESGHEFGHIFTFRHEHLSVPGEPSTGRVQVWIEIESFLSATQKPIDGSAVLLPPTFELIDEGNGRTVLFGLLLPAILKVEDKSGY